MCEIVIDIETTGLDQLKGDRIVEVGAVDGEPYRQVYVVLSNREDDVFVAHLIIIILAHVQNMLLAEINRTALILALGQLFGRVQIFGSELAFAKYCQKEWLSDQINRAVAGIVNRRGINYYNYAPSN